MLFVEISLIFVIFRVHILTQACESHCDKGLRVGEGFEVGEVHDGRDGIAECKRSFNNTSTYYDVLRRSELFARYRETFSYVIPQ